MAEKSDHIQAGELKGLDPALQRKLIGRDRPGKFRKSARPVIPVLRAKHDTAAPIVAPPRTGDTGAQRPALDHPRLPPRREMVRPALPKYERKEIASPLTALSHQHKANASLLIAPAKIEHHQAVKPGLEKPAGHERRTPITPLPIRPRERAREVGRTVPIASSRQDRSRESRTVPVTPSRQSSRRESLVGLSPVTIPSSIGGQQGNGLMPPQGFDGDFHMESVGAEPRGISGMRTYSAFFHGGDEE